MSLGSLISGADSGHTFKSGCIPYHYYCRQSCLDFRSISSYHLFMTVQELISIFEKFPKNAEVLLDTDIYPCRTREKVSAVSVNLKSVILYAGSMKRTYEQDLVVLKGVRARGPLKRKNP